MSIFAELAKGGIEGFGAAIKDAVSAFKADPTKVAEFEQSVDLATINLNGVIAKADSDAIVEVNRTMQAEAKSEHWLQWSWRPLIGVSFAIETTMIGSIFALLLSRIVLGYPTPPDLVPQVTSLVGSFSVLFTAQMAILGVSAAGRSFEKWQRNNGNGK